MLRLEAGSFDAGTGSDPAKNKALPKITIDECLQVQAVESTEKRRQSINSSLPNLSIDIPESWNGLYGDITKDPIA